MIRAYRMIGHLEANLDPLGITPKTPQATLDPKHYGFEGAAFDAPVFVDGILGFDTITPRQLLDKLKGIYCGRIGYEFLHINDAEQKTWLQRRIEGEEGQIGFTPEGKKAILNKLVEAEGFEKFGASRFVGTKRFGLDGGEATIPALEQIIKRGGQLGVNEIVFGMAHRGRLNVLVNVMGKSYRQLFHEFQGGAANPSSVEGSGDVKYHLGASSDREFDGQKVHLSLTPNPSHLEIVNPVGAGQGPRQAVAIARHRCAHLGAARSHPWRCGLCGPGCCGGMFRDVGHQGLPHRRHDALRHQQPDRLHHRADVLALVALLHRHRPDGAGADLPCEWRRSRSVVHAARIAIEFRQKFKKDVVLDMICYRRFGHNESDEPAFTQPLMYRVIKDHQTTLQLYTARLVAEGTVSQAEADAMVSDFNKKLDEEFDASKSHLPNRADWFDGKWQGLEVAPRTATAAAKPACRKRF